MLRFLTAGESHGPGLTFILEGLPRGVPVDFDRVARELRRRQGGYGRGGRMKIERDAVQLQGGVRHGQTLGSPIAGFLENKDWVNWTEVMAIAPAGAGEGRKVLSRPRPGHADLAGALKYDTHDCRDILERASARETAARVAMGALCRCLLEALEVTLASHVIRIGAVALDPAREPVAWDEVAALPDDAPLRCVDPAVEAAMIEAIDAAREAGDSLGGEVEVIVRGLPPGLGSHVHWDRKLEGRLGRALLSIPSVKAVSIGEGVAGAARPGSQVQDEIFYDAAARRFTRPTNRAGGVEGGITNGEEVRLTAYFKPLATLMRPLQSVEVTDKTPFQAQVERSDVCSVPAGGVVAEAMVAFVAADALLEKCGGDSLTEVRRNLEGYRKQLGEF